MRVGYRPGKIPNLTWPTALSRVESHAWYGSWSRPVPLLCFSMFTVRCPGRISSPRLTRSVTLGYPLRGHGAVIAPISLSFLDERERDVGSPGDLPIGFFFALVVLLKVCVNPAGRAVFFLGAGNPPTRLGMNTPNRGILLHGIHRQGTGGDFKSSSLVGRDSGSILVPHSRRSPPTSASR